MDDCFHYPSILKFVVLEELPESIGELSNLEVLNLKRNRLKKLPESIGKLSNLIELNLK